MLKSANSGAQMDSLWHNDLTDEQADELIQRAAEEVVKRKLAVPAVLFLEMNKPLANVVGHAGVFFSPFLIPFFGFDRVNDYSRLVSSRARVEQLIERIEALARTPSQEVHA